MNTAEDDHDVSEDSLDFRSSDDDEEVDVDDEEVEEDEDDDAAMEEMQMQDQEHMSAVPHAQGIMTQQQAQAHAHHAHAHAAAQAQAQALQASQQAAMAHPHHPHGHPQHPHQTIAHGHHAMPPQAQPMNHMQQINMSQAQAAQIAAQQQAVAASASNPAVPNAAGPGAGPNNNNNPNNNPNPSSNGGNSTSTETSLDIDNEPALEGYERTDRIGQGAYGIVYRGIQRSTGVTVAIKRIPFADAAPEGGVPCNVIREISLLRELDHPNVVRLLDVNQARPGELYLVFEYVAHDLKTFLDKSQPSKDAARRQGLPPHLVRSFMRQILEGVGYCHTYRILHRDLKPHNLLISSDGSQVKLADFGLARLSGLPSGPYTSEVVTLWYRAPELLMGATRYCGPVDVWSIGCIFAEMATGYALFPGRSDIDQLFKIFQRRGTPTNEPTLNRLPHYNPEFPKWHPRPITDFVNLDKFGTNHAADLLEQLLQYDPEKRLICKQALHHPFFFES